MPQSQGWVLVAVTGDAPLCLRLEGWCTDRPWPLVFPDGHCVQPGGPERHPATLCGPEFHQPQCCPVQGVRGRRVLHGGPEALAQELLRGHIR